MPDPAAIVLVEGDSDANAISTIAARLDVDGGAMRVVSAHGVTNFTRVLTELRSEDRAQHVVGLYDDPEEHVVRRALRLAWEADPHDRDDLAALGFHACVADLEDEFIRAIGMAGIEEILEREDELRSFRSMQRQPAQRGRTPEQQLRRFIGTRSMRKVRYGHLLATAVDLDRIPPPVEHLFDTLAPRW